MAALTLGKIAWRSLGYFGRANLAVALGVAATTAVITGALLIGDSMRGSLRRLVLDRLSNVHLVVQARSFFDPQRLQSLRLPDGLIALEPAIVVPTSSVEHRSEEVVHRASQVQLIAVGPGFWKSVDAPLADLTLGEDEVAINASLAKELEVQVGQEVTIRFSKLAGVPGDMSLGRRDDATMGLPGQRVVAILPDNSVGGLSFQPKQTPPRNVWASLQTVADIAGTAGRVNAAVGLVAAGAAYDASVSRRWAEELNDQYRPAVEDYGLQLDRHTRVFPDPQIDDVSAVEQPPQTIYDYYQVTSRELIIDTPTGDALYQGLADYRPTRMMAYLANSIARVAPSPTSTRQERLAVEVERKVAGQPPPPGSPSGAPWMVPIGDRPLDLGSVIEPVIVDASDQQLPSPASVLSRWVPYSIVVGVDANEELNLDQYREIALDRLYVPYCWINSWLAEQTEAKPGDWLRVTYFQPETADGQQVELAVEMMVAGVVPITEPKRRYVRSRPAAFDQPPTPFNDPHMTPRVPGVTDQESISQWDLPFTLTYPIEPADDAYWNHHRLTPKLFLPYRYASARAMFGSRFGTMTSLRIAAASVQDANRLRATMEESLLATRPFKGLIFQPIRWTQLQAAHGTTPFDGLFLALSFFVIVASLMLVYLLLKLGVQFRAPHIALMLATGFTAKRVRRLMLQEHGLVCCGGVVVGVLMGIGYGRLMLIGLETLWVGAINTPFLRFDMTGTSLVVGAVAGGGISLLAIAVGLRQLARLDPQTILRGRSWSDGQQSSGARWLLVLAGLLAVGSIGLLVAGVGRNGMDRAGAFFGSGMLLLVASLLALRGAVTGTGGAPPHRPRLSLTRLAWRSVHRNPTRSLLAIGMIAVASFLISSMSVFQVSPDARGYGGFEMFAESAVPVLENLASSAVQRNYLGPDAEQLQSVTIVPFRMRIGNDASCTNLYHVQIPTILGVPPQLAALHDRAPDQFAFAWADVSDEENPWLALEQVGDGSRDLPIPVVVDLNTAAWSLKQGARLDELIEIEIADRKLYFRTVGLLSNSIFQGKLLIGKRNFERLFPEENGFRFFLIDPGQQSPEVVANLLEQGWSDFGLDVQPSERLLRQFLDVQNTYLSAFQALGALGLLLGTIGLAAVQMRSVIERRRELAVLQAMGFAPRRLRSMITLETMMLLGSGLLIGVGCAAVALVPYLIEVGPQLSVIGPVLMLGVVCLLGFVVVWLTLRRVAAGSLVDNLRND
ncbi:MAG: hypothetical protein KatS3mg111_2409 [Pirellulaceae bacterium]|nr:MAG: hypothetical protein KatS3mg111_2409 [Pirellulaceae bacterium]